MTFQRFYKSLCTRISDMVGVKIYGFQLVCTDLEYAKQASATPAVRKKEAVERYSVYVSRM